MADLTGNERVDPEQVKEIVDTDLADGSIIAHIQFANTLASRCVGLSTTELEQIELLLSAHFVAIQDPLLASESIGGEFSVNYHKGQLKDGLKFTAWGQQALALDTTGTLANLGKQKALFRVHSSGNY
jgi:hypothetical protein